MLPEFLIIGAMRCGTTALSGFVRAHPGVFIPPRKEMHYFDVGMDRGLAWYESYFAGVGNGTVPGEATPGYLYHPGTARRIHEQLPNARLIAILRSPVDRSYSHYWHNHRRDRETRTFEQALADEREGRFPTNGGEANYFVYLGRGHYVEQLERYTSLFGRDQILVLLNRDLRADRNGVVAQVWDHIGAGQPSQSLDELLAIKRPVSLRGRVKRIVRGRGRQRPERYEYPTMDSSTRRDLISYFEPDITAAEEWLGVSLDHWRS